MLRACAGAVLAFFAVEAAAQTPMEKAWSGSVAQGLQAASVKDWARAEKQLQTAVSEAQSFGARDPRIGTTLNSLGLVYRAEHKYPEAENSYKRALVTIESSFPGSIDVANVNFNIMTVLLDENRYDQVPIYAQKALPIYEKLVGLSSLRTAAVFCLEGDAFRLAKRYPEAEAALRQCADIREKNSGLSNLEVAEALESLARVLAAQGKIAQAEPRYKLVEKIRESSSGLTSPVLAQDMEEHASVLKALGREKEADKLTLLAAAIRKQQAR